MSNPNPETRRWRLRGYDKDKDLVHDETCVGDRELNAALAVLERDPTVTRATAAAL